ncbi:hypothetical protein P280DRAFT_514849 [Massarina eburnea CBS 473.64]|uniref:Heterokaryon incompatibility domain-containing protein n=1 Tax=Massarina eburnea CBS 473.64 TaxID=1395130 RepID=A0A6A6S9E9_9PLEO|nr:hypothetical protein P280DRAFT_514849 [Massarina eburnea CBS 473.64]
MTSPSAGCQTSGDENEEIVCALFDVPPNGKDGIVYIALSYCWGGLKDQWTISVIHQYQEADDETLKARQKSNPESKAGVDLIGRNDFPFSRDLHQQRFNVTVSLYSALRSLRKGLPRPKKQSPLLDGQPV